MSVSNMVADKQKEPEDMKGLPTFDKTNVVTWSKKLKMYLMRKKRNHIGLEPKPARPRDNAAQAIKEE